MKKEVKIEGMSCGHCQKRVEKALAEVSGISKVSVELEAGLAKFEAADEVSEAVIKETIEDAGYDVVSIENR